MEIARDLGDSDCYLREGMATPCGLRNPLHYRKTTARHDLDKIPLIKDLIMAPLGPRSRLLPNCKGVRGGRGGGGGGGTPTDGYNRAMSGGRPSIRAEGL